MARELYKAAGVSEGRCEKAEIEQFQTYLGPKEYQLIVVDPVRGGVIFTGEAHKNAFKVIQIEKTHYEDENGEQKAHYDGLYSVAPIMNRSKFCRYCCKGYDHENAAHHNCLHANCPSCMRRRNKDSEGCSEYTGWSNPTITCSKCNRQFYGEDCYKAHLIQSKQEETTMQKELRKKIGNDNNIKIPPKEIFKSVCEMYRKCKTCAVYYKVKDGVQHKCGHGQCSNCLEYVDLYNHKCYIVSECYRQNKRCENKRKAEQRCLEAIKRINTSEGQLVQDVVTNPITNKEQEQPQSIQEQKRRKAINEVKKKLQDLGMDCTEIPENKLMKFYGDHFEWGEIKRKKETELVFADIECSIDESRTLSPNLICFERETSDEKYHIWGTTCIREFRVPRLFSQL